jgi:integrase
MLAQGTPLHVVSEVLGHASIMITKDVYGHLYPGDMDRYADRLDSAAENTDPAKIRPDDDDARPDTK